ncbi:MAG: hypothetical protein RR448_09050 [Niameybacter sp.]
MKEKEKTKKQEASKEKRTFLLDHFIQRHMVAKMQASSEQLLQEESPIFH